MTSSAPKQETPRTDEVCLGEWEFFRTDGGNLACHKTDYDALANRCRELERALSASRQGEFEPVLWAVTCNESFVTGNLFEIESLAQHCLERLNQSHPDDRREIVPLYSASRSSAPAEPLTCEHGYWPKACELCHPRKSAPEELVGLIEKLDQERSHAAEQYGVMDLRIEDYDKLKRHLSRPAADREDARRYRNRRLHEYYRLTHGPQGLPTNQAAHHRSYDAHSDSMPYGDAALSSDQVKSK